jgi:hypothetical protein
MKKFGVGLALVLTVMVITILSFQHYNVTTGASIATTVGELYGGWILLLIGVVAVALIYSKEKLKQ